MSFKQNFFNIFKSLNPFNYIELSNNRISTVMKYFIFIVMISAVITFAIIAPKLYNIDSYLSSGVKNFESLSVTSNLQVGNSFALLTDPLVSVTTDNNKTLNKGLVLINSQELMYKKFLFFGKTKTVSLDKSLDFVNDEGSRRLLIVGIFFLLPSIIFWSIVFWSAYFVIIIFFTYILILMASGSLRIDASAVHLFKMAVYSSTVLVLAQVLLLPFYKSMLIPIAAYWLFVMCVVFLWYDSPPGRGGSIVNSRSRDDSDSDSGNNGSSGYGSKTKSIFGEKSSSGFSSRKTPAKDSYDVDENGNMRSGSSKKHKSYNDDNDGYVEL